MIAFIAGILIGLAAGYLIGAHKAAAIMADLKAQLAKRNLI